jgi:hypothetical protein
MPYNKYAKYVFSQEKSMEYVRVRKTDLARNTSEIIRNVLRGQPTIVENHGQPEVIIVDFMDYLVLQAIVHFYSIEKPAQFAPQESLEAELAGLGLQERYNLAMAYYLSKQCDVKRLGELLQTSPVSLSECFKRLDIPLTLSV